MDLPGLIHDFLLVFLGLGVLYIRGSGSSITSQSHLFCLFVGICFCLYIFILYSIKLAFCSCRAAPYLRRSHKCFNHFCCDVHKWFRIFQRFPPLDRGRWITSVVCTSIFFSLITTIPDTSWYGIIWTTKASQIIEQDLISNSQQIGIHLSTDFFIPFEFISLILLVALIGAIAVARQ